MRVEEGCADAVPRKVKETEAMGEVRARDLDIRRMSRD